MKAVLLCLVALASSLAFADRESDLNSRAQYAAYVVEEFHADLPRFLAQAKEELAAGSIDCSVDSRFQGVFQSVQIAEHGQCRFRTVSGKSCESRFANSDVHATKRYYYCGGKYVTRPRSKAAIAYSYRVFVPVRAPKTEAYSRYTYPSGNALVDAYCQQNPGSCNYNYGYYKRGL